MLDVGTWWATWIAFIKCFVYEPHYVNRNGHNNCRKDFNKRDKHGYLLIDKHTYNKRKHTCIKLADTWKRGSI